MHADAAFGPTHLDPGSSGSGPHGDKTQHGQKEAPDKKEDRDKSKHSKQDDPPRPLTASRKCALHDSVVTVCKGGFGEEGPCMGEDVDEDVMEAWEEGVRNHSLLQVFMMPGMSDALGMASAPTCLSPLTKVAYAKAFRPM